MRVKCVECGNGDHIEYPNCCNMKPYCRIHETERIRMHPEHREIK